VTASGPAERKAAEERVWRLVSAARRIADPADALGLEARAVLPAATGLSPEGVALALERCLETHPSDGEMAALVASVDEAPRAHVLLSANVFVAAHRAIALGLAASETVFVRPSRREPQMARLLARAAPDLFGVVDELEPSPGDHVFVYGTDETIATVRRDLGPDVTIYAHGSGLGVVVVDVSGASRRALREVADSIAEDVVVFDQRGCLSPRVVFAHGLHGLHGLHGEPEGARTIAEELARALERAERRVPRGRLSMDEANSAVRYRETMRYVGETMPAGAGWVGLDVAGGPVVVPPVGRHVHVMVATDLARSAAPLAGLVVTVATAGPSELGSHALSCFPGARASPVGRMQRPAFDGPVDLRPFAR
jgi:hypothetical protein